MLHHWFKIAATLTTLLLLGAMFQNCTRSLSMTSTAAVTSPSNPSSQSSGSQNNGIGYNGKTMLIYEHHLPSGLCPNGTDAVDTRIELDVTSSLFPISAELVTANCQTVAQTLTLAQDVTYSADLETLNYQSQSLTGTSETVAYFHSQAVIVSCRQELSASGPEIEIVMTQTSATAPIQGLVHTTNAQGVSEDATGLAILFNGNTWDYGNTPADPGHFLHLGTSVSATGYPYNFKLLSAADGDFAQNGRIGCVFP